jgi:hypothetical protein
MLDLVAHVCGLEASTQQNRDKKVPKGKGIYEQTKQKKYDQREARTPDLVRYRC